MGELNLVPYYIKEKNSKNIKIKNYLSILVVIIVLLVGSLYAPYKYLSSLQNKNAELQAQINREKSVFTESERLKSEIARLKAYIDKVDIITKEKILVAAKVKGLEKFVPKDVILTNLSYTNSSINITATAKSYNSISEFAANLQMSTEYSRSLITNIVVDAGGYTFTITTSQVGGGTK